MKKSTYHQIVGCLVDIGETSLANAFIVEAKKNFPSSDAPPANISKKAERLWKDHVWPKYKKVIKQAGDAASQWQRAVFILKKSAEKRNIPVWTSDILSGDSEEYQKYFEGKMKDFGVTSPKDITPEQWEQVDKGWKSEKEQAKSSSNSIEQKIKVRKSTNIEEVSKELQRLIDTGIYWEDALVALRSLNPGIDDNKVMKEFKRITGKRPDQWQRA